MTDAPLIALTAPIRSASYDEAYAADIGRLAALAVSGIEAAGGRTLLLDASGADLPADARELVDIESVDAVLVLGGGDVDPDLYGSAGHPSINGVDRRADELELALIRAARTAGRPVLAICRGTQLLNVSCGGTLIEDLGPESFHKDHSPAEDMVEHDVMLVAETRLRGILGSGHATVKSSHHQAVGELGAGLVVSALAEDGIIEAIEVPESKGGEWVLGVQWHPEEPGTPAGQFEALLGAFMQEAATRRRRRSNGELRLQTANSPAMLNRNHARGS